MNKEYRNQIIDNMVDKMGDSNPKLRELVEQSLVQVHTEYQTDVMPNLLNIKPKYMKNNKNLSTRFKIINNIVQMGDY